MHLVAVEAQDFVNASSNTWVSALQTSISYTLCVYK
jgi:hypothetical protein